MSVIPKQTRRCPLVLLFLVVLMGVTNAFVTPPHRIVRYYLGSISSLRETNLIDKEKIREMESNISILQEQDSLQGPPPITELPKLLSKEDTNDHDSFSWPITVMLLCWSVTFMSALDRAAMSVAMLPLSTEFGYTESIKGQVSSLFSVGYGIGILPIGIALSVVSPRLMMAVGIALWSLGTLATPSMAAGGMAAMMPLFATRAAVGAAESVVLPTLQRILSEWIPADRKSVAMAIVFSGFHTGTVAAYLVSPYVMDWTNGWRGLFLTYGAIGLALLVPWLVFAQDSPEEQETELKGGLVLPSEMLRATKEEDSQNNDMTTTPSPLQSAMAFFQTAPIGEMLSSKGAQAILIAHAANNWGLYNNLAWTPTFYAEQYGLNVKDSALYSILPSAAGAVGGFVAGMAADAWIRHGDPASHTDERTTRIRKIFQGIALYCPAIFLAVLAHHIPEQPWVAQTLLTGSVGLSAFNSAGYGPAAQEKAGSKWSGLLYSLTSLPGVMLGSLGVYATGQILDLTHQDWSIVFGVNSLVNVVGATGFVLLYNATKEFE